MRSQISGNKVSTWQENNKDRLPIIIRLWMIGIYDDSTTNIAGTLKVLPDTQALNDGFY